MSPKQDWSARLSRWLIDRYPAEFQRAHGPELRDASAWMLADAPSPRSAVRLVASLAWGALVQHGSEFAADVRYACRTLRRSKWFAVCAALSFAIGIGTVLPIYMTFSSTLFRNVEGIAAPEKVVGAMQAVSYPSYQHLRESPQSPFAELTAYMPRVPFGFRATAGGASERIWGQLSAPNYFDVLRISMFRGRGFSGVEADPSRLTPAVISHRLWQTRFGEQPDTLGRQVQLNGQPVEITGIAPPGFAGSSPLIAAADVWIPATAQGFTETPVASSKVNAFQIAGRLRGGVSKKRAEEILDSQMRHLDPQPKPNKQHRLQLMPGARVFAVPDSMVPLVVGLPGAIAILTLWIACANVGAMMLARAASRRPEVAVRAALGAGRGRIVRQLLTESLLLSVAGAALGLGLTIYSLQRSTKMVDMLPGYSRVDFAMGFDGLLVTFGTALFCTLLCGLIPAWQVSRIGVSAALKSATDPALPHYRWFSTRNQLILQQVAAALCLLLLCGYMLFGLRSAARLDLGFEPAGLGTISIDPLRDGFTPGAAADLLAKLPGEVAESAGVRSAALAENTPAAMAGVGSMRVSTRGSKQTVRVASLHIGEGYFATLGIPILQGRTLLPADHRDGATAVLINQALASELWPAGDPVGQPLEVHLGDHEPREQHQVAGVVKDFRTQLLQPDAGAAIFLPLTPSRLGQMRTEGWTLVVRVAPGAPVLDAARTAITARHAGLTVFNANSVQESSDRTMALVKETFAVYGGIGLFGLLLSAVGLAGVTAYAVALRTREIGIRVALGARGGQVMRLVLREGLALLAVGAGLGLGLALLVERVLHGYLKGFADLTRVSFTDPVLLGGGCALMALLCIGACYLPARRATRINPVIALRE